METRGEECFLSYFTLRIEGCVCGGGGGIEDGALRKLPRIGAILV